MESSKTKIENVNDCKQHYDMAENRYWPGHFHGYWAPLASHTCTAE